jgi:hypothetical protein
MRDLLNDVRSDELLALEAVVDGLSRVPAKVWNLPPS